jgi:hypothetical protein
MEPKILVCFFAFAFTMGSAADGPKKIRILDVDRQIQTVGITNEIAYLQANRDQWHQLLSSIGKGESGWISIGLKLKDSADGSASETLTLAFGEALEHNPSELFNQIGSMDFITSICGGPDVDDPKYGSLELSMRAIEKRISNVRSLRKKQFELKRAECLDELQKSKDGMRSFFQK